MRSFLALARAQSELQCIATARHSNRASWQNPAALSSGVAPWQASGNGPTSGNASQPQSLDDALLGAMLLKNAPVAGSSTGSTGAADHAQSAALQGMLPKNAPVAGAATGSTGARVPRRTASTPSMRATCRWRGGLPPACGGRKAQHCGGTLRQVSTVPVAEGFIGVVGVQPQRRTPSRHKPRGGPAI